MPEKGQSVFDVKPQFRNITPANSLNDGPVDTQEKAPPRSPSRSPDTVSPTLYLNSRPVQISPVSSPRSLNLPQPSYASQFSKRPYSYDTVTTPVFRTVKAIATITKPSNIGKKINNASDMVKKYSPLSTFRKEKTSPVQDKGPTAQQTIASALDIMYRLIEDRELSDYDTDNAHYKALTKKLENELNMVREKALDFEKDILVSMSEDILAFVNNIMDNHPQAETAKAPAFKSIIEGASSVHDAMSFYYKNKGMYYDTFLKKSPATAEQTVKVEEGQVQRLQYLANQYQNKLSTMLNQTQTEHDKQAIGNMLLKMKEITYEMKRYFGVLSRSQYGVELGILSDSNFAALGRAEKELSTIKKQLDIYRDMEPEEMTEIDKAKYEELTAYTK